NAVRLLRDELPCRQSDLAQSGIESTRQGDLRGGRSLDNGDPPIGGPLASEEQFPLRWWTFAYAGPLETSGDVALRQRSGRRPHTNRPESRSPSGEDSGALRLQLSHVSTRWLNASRGAASRDRAAP